MTGWIGAELRRFANTARWSWAGWLSAWGTEKSLRQWTLANALSAALALTLDLSGGERALVLSLGLLVLAAELANTAVEDLTDHLWPGRDPRAGRIKDIGSAVVAVTAVAAGVAWIAVLAG